MAVTVPSSNVNNFNLQTSITQLTALIAAAGNNGPLVFALTKARSNQQLELVLGLLGGGNILASAILANETYAAATQVGGDQN